jgi:hypothetical protein
MGSSQEHFPEPDHILPLEDAISLVITTGTICMFEGSVAADADQQLAHLQRPKEQDNGALA